MIVDIDRHTDKPIAILGDPTEDEVKSCGYADNV